MSNRGAAGVPTLGRCICIITGASRGFGRALARQVCHRLEPGSVLLLVARSGTLLEELREELSRLPAAAGLAFRCAAVDLSASEGVKDAVSAAQQQTVHELDHVLLINNAASLGSISRFESFTDVDQVSSYLALNVSSPLALTAGVLKAFPQADGLRWSVVNCSSTLALQALPCWALYCTAKAAREMMFRVLAEERPDVKVLNYSPGPMDTEMQEEASKTTGVRNDLLPCQESAAKLIQLLVDNDFPSGAHLDFFEA